ncbi:hypothetical protein RFI_12794, partial [Reticulomyxa filosa]
DWSFNCFTTLPRMFFVCLFERSDCPFCKKKKKKTYFMCLWNNLLYIVLHVHKVEIATDDHSNIIIHGDPEEHGQTSYFDIEAPLDTPKMEDGHGKRGFEQGFMSSIPKYLRKIEIFGFIPNIRGVFTPLQLALLADILNAIGASADLVAEYNTTHMKASTSDKSKKPVIMHIIIAKREFFFFFFFFGEKNIRVQIYKYKVYVQMYAHTHTKASKLSQEDVTKIGGKHMSFKVTSKSNHSNLQKPSKENSNNDSTGDNNGNGNGAGNGSANDNMHTPAIIDIDLQIYSCMLLLLENNVETPPIEWFLSDSNESYQHGHGHKQNHKLKHKSKQSQAQSPTFTSMPTQKPKQRQKHDHIQQHTKQHSLHYDACSAWLSDLNAAHVALHLQNIRVLMKQIPTEAYTNITIGKVEMFEFLPSKEFQECMQIGPNQLVRRPILIMRANKPDNTNGNENEHKHFDSEAQRQFEEKIATVTLPHVTCIMRKQYTVSNHKNKDAMSDSESLGASIPGLEPLIQPQKSVWDKRYFSFKPSLPEQRQEFDYTVYPSFFFYPLPTFHCWSLNCFFFFFCFFKKKKLYIYVCVNLEPAEVEVDLDLLSRLKLISQAFSFASDIKYNAFAKKSVHNYVMKHNDKHKCGRLTSQSKSDRHDEHNTPSYYPSFEKDIRQGKKIQGKPHVDVSRHKDKVKQTSVAVGRGDTSASNLGHNPRSKKMSYSFASNMACSISVHEDEYVFDDHVSIPNAAVDSHNRDNGNDNDNDDGNNSDRGKKPNDNTNTNAGDNDDDDEVFSFFREITTTSLTVRFSVRDKEIEKLPRKENIAIKFSELAARSSSHV